MSKKIAILLSPVWFLADIIQFSYKANFSLFVAGELIFINALDFELKRAIASRMLEYPSTLERRSVVGIRIEAPGICGTLDRIVFCALRPAEKAQNLLF